MPELTLRGLEYYIAALRQFKQQVGGLVSSGDISELTAGRLAADAEYNFFNQLVTVDYDRDDKQILKEPKGEEL